MKTSLTMKIVLAALIAASLTPGLFALTVEEAQERLITLDDARNFEDTDFSAVMTFVSEDPEEGVERQVIQQFRRDGEDKFLMLIQEPAVMLGQGYLRIEDGLWFYDPESRQFSYTSLKEQFSGTDARNSDFGASSYANDYQVVSVEEGTLGRYEVYILELEATSNEVTYPRQTMWVTRDLFLPLKIEDYSEAGRLLRTSLFPSYSRAGDNYIATTMIFVDELVEGKSTQISITDISLDTVPDSVFTKSYVERVNR